MVNASKERIRSKVIRAFVESLDDFGDAGMAAILSTLQRRGIFLEDRQVSLSMLYDILIELLGEQATQIVMENVIIELDRLHDDAIQDHTRTNYST